MSSGVSSSSLGGSLPNSAATAAAGQADSKIAVAELSGELCPDLALSAGKPCSHSAYDSLLCESSDILRRYRAAI